MPQIVNTNILAQNAQRQLNKSQGSQATSIERLSSGLRINSAKDDAAGLAISTRFETQVRGLNQAVRNANDGISLAQTAEGSLQEMGNIMQRMRELAVQSANDTNSDQDRLSLQSEVDQLYNELERISDSTEFNGVKLLDGSAGERTFQVGANSGQSISFSVEAVTTEGLDLNNFSSTGDLNGGRVGSATLSDIAANTVTINDVAIDAFDFGVDGNAVSDGTNITQLKDALNEQTQSTGVTAEAYNVVTGSAANGTTSGLQIQVGTGSAVTVSDSSSIDELASVINRDVAGVTASVEASGGIQLSNDTGQTITVTGTVAGSGFEAGSYNGYISLTSTNNTEIEVGIGSAGSAADLQALGFNTSTGSASVTGTTFEASAITDDDKITINDVEIGAIALSTTGQQGFNVAKAINDVSAQTGVTATLGATTVTSAIDLTKTDNATATDLTINGVTVSAATDYGSVQLFADAINTAVTANPVELGDIAATVDSNDNLVLTSASGADIDIDQNVGVFRDLENVELRSGTIDLATTQSGVDTFTINGVDVLNTGADYTSLTAFATGINNTLEDVTASVDADTSELVLTSNNGAEITIAQSQDTFTNTTKAANGLFSASLSLTSENGEDIMIGSNASANATEVVGTRGATVVTSNVNLAEFDSDEDANAITINGTDILTSTTAPASDQALVDQINTAMSAVANNDIVASLNTDSDIVLTSASGQNIDIAQNIGGFLDLNNGTITTSSGAFTAGNGAGNWFGGGVGEGVATFGDSDSGHSLTINGEEIATSGGYDSEALFLAAITGLDSIASASVTGANLTVTGANGSDVVIGGSAAALADIALTAGEIATGVNNNITESSLTFTTGTTAEQNQASAVAKLGLTRQGGNEEVTGLGLSITTVANASEAIEKIDAALDKVSTVRAGLGAFQNRLGSTISNLENVSQNLSAANSRIRDADFAIESANLSKTQILQQAGIAMLSQANASQQGVLSLLG